MSPDEIAQFIQTIVRLVDLLPETIKYLSGFVTEKLYQNIVFIFEIQIDSTISHAGFPGNLGHGRLVKTLTGKHLHRRLQDKMILVIFIFFIDFTPPGLTKENR
jgi:hypothetical protein